MASTATGSGENLSKRTEEAEKASSGVNGPGMKGTIKRTLAEFSAKGGTDLAAGLTYYTVFSIFPALLAIVSLLGIFGGGDDSIDQILEMLQEDFGVAEGQLETIQQMLSEVTAVGGAGILFAVGVLGAMWSASNYVNGFSRVMNTVYGVKEGRPVWKLRPWMLMITAIVLICVVLVIVALVLSGGIAEGVGSAIGLGETAVTVWGIAKWPVVVAIVVFIIALLYWGTPNVRPPKFRWLSGGALLGLAVVAVTTAGFGFYVANFGSYNATFGAVAGVIVMLTWLWLVNTSLVLGAFFDAELERARELAAGLPAEEEFQLELRGAKGVEKAEQKQAELVAQSRRIRLEADAD